MGKFSRGLRGRLNSFEPIDRLAIFNRDGWHCQNCDKPTPKRLMGTHKHNAPTIDHIKRISDGGDNDPENLRLLCWKCNVLDKH